MADWKKIEAEYITTDTSYRKLADKYGVDQATIARRAKKHDWVSKRQQHADKTQAKILTADTQRKVDRASRLMTVADKLLKKVEILVDKDDYLSATAIKNLSDALRNIRDTQMIRSDADMREQEARIRNLEKQVENNEDTGREIVVRIEGSDLNEYSC